MRKFFSREILLLFLDSSEKRYINSIISLRLKEDGYEIISVDSFERELENTEYFEGKLYLKETKPNIWMLI